MVPSAAFVRTLEAYLETTGFLFLCEATLTARVVIYCVFEVTLNVYWHVVVEYGGP